MANGNAADGGTRLVAYEWMAWQNFLASSLFSRATRLHARFDDSVEVVMGQIPPHATHFLFHLNVTLTSGFPASRTGLLAALASRGIRPLNERVTDISKPFIHQTCTRLGLSSTLAERTLPADVPVVIKSSLNYGGKTEKYLPPAEVARMGLRLPENIDPENYRIMRSGDVPGPWWNDPSLCIERYISNSGNRWHRVYLWQDRILVREALNPRPIKKLTGNISSRGMCCTLVDGRYRTAAGSEPAPANLVARLAAFVPAFGLDFGTIDLVSDDAGQHYIIDVNTTPFFASKAADVLSHLEGVLPH